MAIDPNIALGVRPLELPNQLAQYGQIAQIQNAQNQHRMANLQAQEYERARGEEEGLRNYLTKANLAKPEERTGLFQFGKTGRDYLKTLAEQDTAAATLAETKSKTTEREFKLAKDKLAHGWQSMGDARTPEDAMAKLQEGVSKGYFSMADATKGIAELQSIQTPEDYKKWRIGKVMALMDAKDQLPLMMDKVERQDVGGKVVNIQMNPAMPGYGQPIAGGDIAKTKTFGDITAEGNLGVAQGQLQVARDRLAQEGLGVTYQSDANNQIIALPTRLKPGQVATARPVIAPGGGMQPLEGKPSEAVGKEQMSINQQKSTLEGALKAVETNPSAFGAARGLMGETLGGKYYDTPEEAQARAYVFNVVSNVIHARAGTAQTPGERETLLRFLPGELDDDKQVKNKINAYVTYISDLEKGTTKKRSSPTAPTLSPVDQQALQWANSNPADPRAAAIKQRLGR